ncbi:SubName: Full=Uncharacterized protein {ECO:0000313/EMBL:CCA68471.1} [Serendipita indica DSM 11827]|nr:SubName: Full=Uncharacterized protein {ECO:0000313/EMBL:CCA68471.1} [Serendipita indica DSM 11827]
MRVGFAFALLVGGVLAAPADNTRNESDQLRLTQPITNQAQSQVATAHVQHGVKETNQTIYKYLSQQIEFTKLVKIIDWEKSYISVLNSTDDNITFFAPNNKALTPPKRRRDHQRSSLSLAHIYAELERLEAKAQRHEGGDDDDDEEKKKRFKKIVHALLKYHTLPTSLDKPALYRNATYETALKAKDGSFDDQPRRVTASNDLIGRLFINFWAKVEWLSVSAANGYIYTTNHPLIPPPSIMDELFLIDDFSTLSSALQKVGLDDALQWRWKKSSPRPKVTAQWSRCSRPTTGHSSGSQLVFASWLFSPAGEKALKKLLQFHIVPNYILHSDWVHKVEDDDESAFDIDGQDWYDEVRAIVTGSPDPTTLINQLRKQFYKWFNPIFTSHPTKEKTVKKCRHHEKKYKRSLMRFVPVPSAWPPHHSPPDITVNITVPTLLDDHSVRFVVAKPKRNEHHPESSIDKHNESQMTPPLARSYVFVHGNPTLVEGTARNGAIYALSRVLHPFKQVHPDGEDVSEEKMWEGWEDWLPAWGNA